MCMTKREKALARFYGEIKEALEDDPQKGYDAKKKAMEMAEEATEVEMESKKGNKFKKPVPKHSVDTIKAKIREEYFPKKKQSKGEEVLAFFKQKMDEQNGQKVEA